MDENENRKNIEGLESMISPSTLLLEREEVQFELQLIGLGLGKLHILKLIKCELANFIQKLKEY